MISLVVGLGIGFLAGFIVGMFKGTTSTEKALGVISGKDAKRFRKRTESARRMKDATPRLHSIPQ